MEPMDAEVLIQSLHNTFDWRERRKAARLLSKDNSEKSVEALIKLLEEEQDDDVISSAVMSLTQMYSFAVMEMLIKPRFFQSPNPDLRWAVAHSIGEMGNTSHFLYLNQLITDENWIVKEEAHLALEKIIVRFSKKTAIENFSEDDVKRLIRMLEVEYEKLQMAMVDFLVERKDVSYQFLLESLGTNSVTRKVGVIRALSKIKNMSAVPHLVEHLDSEHLIIRKEIIRALASIGTIFAYNKIIDQLGDWNGEINQVATEELIALEKNKTILPILTERLRSVHNVRVKKNILYVLGKTGNKAAMDSIVANIGNMNFSVRSAAMTACANFGENVAPIMKKALDTLSFDIRDIIKMAGEAENKFTKISAIKALGALRQPAAIPVLSALAQEQDHTIARYAKEALKKVFEANYAREGAAYVLGEIGDASSAQILINSLKDPVPEVRRAVLVALGNLHSSEATDEIAELLLREERAEVRVEAVKSLGRLSDFSPKTREVLLWAFTDSSYAVRMEAARILAKFGEEEIVERLLSALKDTSYRVRRNVLYALYTMGLQALPNIQRVVLSEQDWTLRMNAILLIGMLHDGEFVPQLQRVLQAETDERLSEQIHKVMNMIARGAEEHDYENLLI